MKLNPKTSIGHLHLKVSDLERSIRFYTEVLGFELTARYGTGAAFLSAGGYHHHIGLNTWESEGGTSPIHGTTGLYHFAILYPNRKDLANALKELQKAQYKITGASDHGVSEAIYLEDPDGNGIELYWDRPKSMWKYNSENIIVMGVEPLNLDDLLKEAD